MMKSRLWTALGSVTVAGAIAMVAVPTAVAAEAPSGTRSVQLQDQAASATEQLIAKADPFVRSVNGRFVLDAPRAASALTAAEIAQVTAMIDGTNAVLAKGPVTASSIPTATAQGRQLQAMFREGVTKVEPQWFGFRVWLSKDVVRGIGGGIGIGALWIPEPLVSKILASLGGAVAAFAPGGVVFNWSPVFTPATPLGTFWGQEWQ